MRLLTSLALCLIPVTQAHATEFRCYPPDPAGFYRAAAESPRRYRIVRGRFDFDPALLPYGGQLDFIPHVAPFPAHFEGQVLGAAGFGTDIAFDLRIEPSCIMISCPDFAPGAEVVAFVWQEASGYVLDADPCLAPLFAPTEDNVAVLLACVRGEECQPLPTAD